MTDAVFPARGSGGFPALPAAPHRPGPRAGTSRLPWITAIRLLISWATPAVSSPMAAGFSLVTSWRCAMRRSALPLPTPASSSVTAWIEFIGPFAAVRRVSAPAHRATSRSAPNRQPVAAAGPPTARHHRPRSCWRSVPPIRAIGHMISRPFPVTRRRDRADRRKDGDDHRQRVFLGVPERRLEKPTPEHADAFLRLSSTGS